MYPRMDYGFSLIIENSLFHMMISRGSENKQ